MAKRRDYEALQNWFASQPSQKDVIATTFSKIEEIISHNLPESVRKYSVWWLDKSPNTSHRSYARWLKEGWEVSQLDLGAETVSFKRV